MPPVSLPPLMQPPRSALLPPIPTPSPVTTTSTTSTASTTNQRRLVIRAPRDRPVCAVEARAATAPATTPTLRPCRPRNPELGRTGGESLRCPAPPSRASRRRENRRRLGQGELQGFRSAARNRLGLSTPPTSVLQVARIACLGATLPRPTWPAFFPSHRRPANSPWIRPHSRHSQNGSTPPQLVLAAPEASPGRLDSMDLGMDFKIRRSELPLADIEVA